MARKETKMCVVCGEPFLGTAGKQTCGGACRTALSRLLSQNKRPSFYLLAQSKGQKVPPLNRLKFTPPTTEKKSTLSDFSKKRPTDEPEQHQKEVMTVEQKFTKMAELEKQLRDLKNEQSPRGVHPKVWKLTQNDKISEIQDQINNLK